MAGVENEDVDFVEEVLEERRWAIEVHGVVGGVVCRVNGLNIAETCGPVVEDGGVGGWEPVSPSVGSG